MCCPSIGLGKDNCLTALLKSTLINECRNHMICSIIFYHGGGVTPSYIDAYTCAQDLFIGGYWTLFYITRCSTFFASDPPGIFYDPLNDQTIKEMSIFMPGCLWP